MVFKLMYRIHKPIHNDIHKTPLWNLKFHIANNTGGCCWGCCTHFCTGNHWNTTLLLYQISFYKSYQHLMPSQLWSGGKEEKQEREGRMRVSGSQHIAVNKESCCVWLAFWGWNTWMKYSPKEILVVKQSEELLRSPAISSSTFLLQ